MCKHCKQPVQKIAEIYLFEPMLGEKNHKLQLGFNQQGHYWFMQDSRQFGIEVRYCPWCGTKLNKEATIKWECE